MTDETGRAYGTAWWNRDTPDVGKVAIDMLLEQTRELAYRQLELARESGPMVAAAPLPVKQPSLWQRFVHCILRK